MPGPALPLAEAANRLKAAMPNAMPPTLNVTVIYSPSDQRQSAQLRMAESLSARTAWVTGGHLFPITEPATTARAVLNLIAL